MHIKSIFHSFVYKARFVEMFGDPVTNTYELQIAILSELGALGRGISKHRPTNDPK